MAPEEKQDSLGSRILRSLPGWAVDLWIFGILIAFFVIRILGSGTGRRVLYAIGLGRGE